MLVTSSVLQVIFLQNSLLICTFGQLCMCVQQKCVLKQITSEDGEATGNVAFAC